MAYVEQEVDDFIEAFDAASAAVTTQLQNCKYLRALCVPSTANTVPLAGIASAVAPSYVQLDNAGTQLEAALASAVASLEAAQTLLATAVTVRGDVTPP